MAESHAERQATYVSRQAQKLAEVGNAIVVAANRDERIEDRLRAIRVCFEEFRAPTRASQDFAKVTINHCNVLLVAMALDTNTAIPKGVGDEFNELLAATTSWLLMNKAPLSTDAHTAMINWHREGIRKSQQSTDEADGG